MFGMEDKEFLYTKDKSYKTKKEARALTEQAVRKLKDLSSDYEDAVRDTDNSSDGVLDLTNTDPNIDFLDDKAPYKTQDDVLREDYAKELIIRGDKYWDRLAEFQRNSDRTVEGIQKQIKKEAPDLNDMLFGYKNALKHNKLVFDKINALEKMLQKTQQNYQQVFRDLGKSSVGKERVVLDKLKDEENQIKHYLEVQREQLVIGPRGEATIQELEKGLEKLIKKIHTRESTLSMINDASGDKSLGN